MAVREFGLWGQQLEVGEAGHQGNQPRNFTKDLMVKVQRCESLVRFAWLVAE